MVDEFQDSEDSEDSEDSQKNIDEKSNDENSRKLKDTKSSLKQQIFNKHYLIFLILFAALYEIFDSYNTSFYPTIVSYIQNDLQIGDSEYYLILTIGSLGLYAVIIVQYLSDIVGRKPIIIVSFFGMGLSIYLLGQSHVPVAFAISLFLMYIFFSSDSWVIMLSEEAPKKRRGTYTYIILLFGVIGVFIIPFLRDILIIESDASSWSNMTLIGWLAMPISLLGLFLRETKAFQDQSEFKQFRRKWSKDVIIAKIKKPFDKVNKKFMFSFIIMSIIVGMNYASFQTIEKFFTTTLSVSSEKISDIIFIAGLGSLIVFGLTGILTDRFGRRIILTIYSVLLTGGISMLVLMTVSENLVGVYIFVVVAQIGFWGCFTLLKIYCIECFNTNIRGAVSGWRSFSFAVGFTLGSLVSSYLVSFISLGALYVILGVWSIIIIPILTWKILPETKSKNLLVVS
ncbi:MAG: MFS transporter [Candidatus Lokiarchaeota archaeon]|nr:MFS transporter [Candidatus Lokiarchaeota archaeon]